MVQIHPSDVALVYTDGERLYTRNLSPGFSVYGERLVSQGGVEFREWDPRRSKLAAMLKKGVGVFPFGKRTDVLYLGAAQGTTVSHISDICVDGTIYAVEISRRALQKLLELSGNRNNVFPILADASRPKDYERVVPRVGVLYQDVAQRDQVSIFLENVRFLAPGGFGVFMAKARSANVAADPSAIYAGMEKRLVVAGFHMVQVTRLDPFARDHAALVLERA